MSVFICFDGVIGPPLHLLDDSAEAIEHFVVLLEFAVFLTQDFSYNLPSFQVLRIITTSSSSISKDTHSDRKLRYGITAYIVSFMTKRATKIAIIEDDQAISQMYRMKFEAEGFEVETAENGKFGLELVDKMRPDIILLDLMMPEMTGDEMLVKLRKTSWGKDTRVIILTNMGEQEAPEIVKTLDVKRFIVKAEMTPRQVAEMVKAELAS